MPWPRSSPARCLDERPLTLALGLNVGLVLAGVLVSWALAALAIPAEQAAAHPFLLGAWAPMDRGGWLLMAVLALLMVAFGTGVAMAYQLAPAAVIGAFDYAYVAFAVLWSWLLLGETPEAGTMLGIALIACGGAMVAGVRVARPRWGRWRMPC